jgi:hypothetical protein
VTVRRSRGDGGLHWDEQRQRWIANAGSPTSPSATPPTAGASGAKRRDAPSPRPGPSSRSSFATTRTASRKPIAATPLPKPSRTGSTMASPAATRPLSPRNVSWPTSTSSPPLAHGSFSSCPPRTSTYGSPTRPPPSAAAPLPISKRSCVGRSPAPRPGTRSNATSSCCVAPLPGSPAANSRHRDGCRADAVRRAACCLTFASWCTPSDLVIDVSASRRSAGRGSWAIERSNQVFCNDSRARSAISASRRASRSSSSARRYPRVHSSALSGARS